MGKWRLRLFWAAVLAVATAAGVKAYLNSLQETVPVVVAATDIPARARITPEMVRVIEIHSADRTRLVPDAFQRPDEVVGRYARRPVAAGEVLRNRPADYTAPDGATPAIDPGEGALADFLPDGTRAIALRADAEAVLGRHVQPGDLVDIIFTSTTDSTGGVYSTLVLQQVEVLDIQRDPERGPDGEVLVTVLVTPEQAVYLALAKRTGIVDLALAPRLRGDPVHLPPASPLHFLGTQPPPTPAEASGDDSG